MKSLSQSGLRTLGLASLILFVGACDKDGDDTDTGEHDDHHHESGASESGTGSTTGGTGTDGSGTSGGTTSVGTTGGTSGTGDATATTGADTSGDTGTGGNNFCQEACVMDADCTVGGVATAGVTCQNNRCTYPTNGCTADSECHAVGSGWQHGTVCTANGGECDANSQACIDIGGGEGRCAMAPNEFLTCETLMWSEVQMPSLDTGSPVTVCANTDFVCKEGVCMDPCESNDDCALIPGAPVCNLDTGICGCTSDDQCTLPGLPVCGANGFCGCGTDADCAENPNGDVCVDGACGCSGVAACTQKVHDGTTQVCEAFAG